MANGWRHAWVWRSCPFPWADLVMCFHTPPVGIKKWISGGALFGRAWRKVDIVIRGEGNISTAASRHHGFSLDDKGKPGTPNATKMGQQQ